MVSAVDFVLFCAGVGILMMSAGVMIALIARTRTPREVVRKTTTTMNVPVPERASDTGEDALIRRLAEFQRERFASPIVQRAARPDVLPIRRRPGPMPSNLQPTNKQNPPKKGGE